MAWHSNKSLQQHMSIEGTSEMREHHLEASGKKAKKARRKKARPDTEDKSTENLKVFINEAIPTLTSSDDAQPRPPPLKKSKKRRKELENMEQQVQGSIKRPEDNERQRSSKRKKHVKFDISLDRQEREPAEEDVPEDPMSMQGNNEDKEVNKPGEAAWVQRASWKSLVGETGRVSFSFSLGSKGGHNSAVLPDGNGELVSLAPKPSMDGQPSNAVSEWIEESSSPPLLGRSPCSNGHSSLSHFKNTSNLVKKSKSPSELESLNHQSVRTCSVAENGSGRDPEKVESANSALGHKQAGQNEHQNVDERVCRFMRSDNYEQEWLEAKRAVKDIFKRARKDALKSMKMFHKKHNQ